jgi:hypothetical protein
MFITLVRTLRKNETPSAVRTRYTQAEESCPSGRKVISVTASP